MNFWLTSTKLSSLIKGFFLKYLLNPDTCLSNLDSYVLEINTIQTIIPTTKSAAEIIKSFKSTKQKRDLLFDHEFEMVRYWRDIAVVQCNDIGMIEEYLIRAKPRMSDMSAEFDVEAIERQIAFEKE